jgi:ABC-type uncharacterized transport system involved in gliding motility auxiliary subunit
MEIMKNNKSQPATHRYTVIALFVALFACIATALLGIVKGVVALQLYTLQFPERLNNALWISGGLIILGLATYVILEPGRVQKFITGRQARFGGNTLVTSVAFLLILGLTNAMVIAPRLNLDKRWDLTEDKANTLAPETLAALETLPEKITATAFFSQNRPKDSAEQLLNNIKISSAGKFEYEFVDPDRDPQRARETGITGDGKILLEMGDRKEIAASADETEILQAMIRLINPNERVVYFLTGHGERDTEQSTEDNSSLTQARATLESKNYIVNTLSLLAENKVPEDADLIVIAGPVQPVSQREVNLLRDYLNNGGALLVMEDPLALTDFGDAADPLAEMLSEDWGITINNDVVIDLDSPDPNVGVSATYDGSHPITRKMNNLATFFPLTRSLNLTTGKENIQANLLVQTTSRSWGETDLSNPGFDEGKETPGPMTLVVAGENNVSGGRVVVFGTSQFAVDQIFDQYGNGDLFANSVDWSAEQENLTNITPKQPITRTFLPASQLRILFLMFIVALAIPGIFLVLGIYTWFARRRQG